MINKVTLIGNLGAIPETNKLESGNQVSLLKIATSENYKDKQGEWQDRTEWHRVVAWNKLSEKIEAYSKGMLIYIEGKLTTRKWQDKEGKDRYTTEVVANYIRVVNKREQTSEAQRQPQPVEQTDLSPQADDDLPF